MSSWNMIFWLTVTDMVGHNSDVQMNKKKVMIKIPWNHVFSNNNRKNKVADIFCCRKAGEKKKL